jgi:hypothetical protein
MHGPVFAADVRERQELLAAHIPVENVAALHDELGKAGASIRRMRPTSWSRTRTAT